jgi:SAM-dependent methyltransferase
MLEQTGPTIHSSEHWDLVAKLESADSVAESELSASMLRCVKSLGPRSLLELASGNGRLARALSEACGRVIGVDISELAVEHARTRYGSESVQFVAASASALPLAERSLDAVTCLRSLWVLPDRAAAYREVRRVLRASGHFVVQLYGLPAECELILCGARVLGRYIPELRVPANATGPFDLNPASFEAEITAAGLMKFEDTNTSAKSRFRTSRRIGESSALSPALRS